MKLTKEEMNLIREIAKNNIMGARAEAKEVLNRVDDDSQLWFVDMCNNLLKDAPSMFDLPADLKGLLSVEDVSVHFHENRYYLSEREKEVVDTIMRIRKINEKFTELDIHYNNATLLYGEPGTGKTSLGKFIAYKTGLPFAYLNFSQVVDSLLGSTAKNISKAFRFAMSTPCIFMLDEIDAISARRENASSGTDKEMGRTTITLMQEMDMLPNETIVIAATNRYDRLDEALLRRFTNKHEVKRFSEEEKLVMMHQFLNDIHMDIDENELRSLAKNDESQAETMTGLIKLIARYLEEKIE